MVYGRYIYNCYGLSTKSELGGHHLVHTWVCFKVMCYFPSGKSIYSYPQKKLGIYRGIHEHYIYIYSCMKRPPDYVCWSTYYLGVRAPLSKWVQNKNSYIYIYRIPPLIYGRYGLYMDYKPLTKRHVHPSILTWQSKYHGISFQYLVGGFKHFFIFHNIWDNPSHWLIFFKGVKTTNQLSL